uniref:Cilia- and flagella-associated protein HOATZ n=1 Tax=Oreochromis niloticus TaxID=8128 RepID=A0A669E2R3_ORENI
MSVQADPPEQEEADLLFIVFEGSSPEDVSHARQLWSSLSLLPPLESRLVSADIHQRLPVSRPQRTAKSPRSRQRQEERRRYAAMGDQRKEILALLRRQRERRIQKELLSVAFKPKGKVGRENEGKEKEQMRRVL